MTNDKQEEKEQQAIGATAPLISKSVLSDDYSLDVLASMHFTYAPLLQNSLPSLSKKELYRVINAVVDIPPEQSTIDKFNPAQKNVYFTLEKVLMAKYFMMYNVALEKEMSKIKEEQKEANEPELVKSDNQSTDQPS